MIVEIGLCATAGFLFLRGIYHSGVLAGWITQGLTMGRTPPPRAPSLPTPAPRFDHDAAERALFLAVPSAWWLDPNRWGDNPTWREDTDRAEPYCGCGQGMIHKESGHDDAIAERDAYIAANAPKCPVCGPKGIVTVLNVHGGVPSLYDCAICAAEFTPNGKETKRSRQAREKRERLIPRTLPCGHIGSITRMREPYTGWHISRCDECKAEWEPRLNDPSGRTLGQGEKVDYALPCGCRGEVTTRSYPSGGWDMGRYAVCKTCDGCWDYADRMDDRGDPRKMHPRSGPVEWPNGNKLVDLPEQLQHPPGVA